MITLDRDGMRFQYCVDGIAIHDRHVLLVQARGFGFWFTPGGRVEMGESSTDALRREMREELGVDVEVGRLLWVVENFFQHDGTPAHELALMFSITLPPGCALLDTRHEHHCVDAGVPLTFRWFPLDQLDEVFLVPAFLPRALRALPERTEHVIHVD
jgi:ADP-ribose pyrophosphatase YjhB (NUDIX family)